MAQSKKSTVGIFSRTFTLFGAAVSAAAAVRNHRRPSDQSLQALGIDPETFPSVREF